MSDQLQNIRGRAVGRIADVIAQARQQAANPGDASFAPPSLDNPSRPKTPAGFDERINMDSSLSLYQMRTAANSRQQALLRNSSSNSSHLRGSMSKTSKLKELKAATQTTKPIESPSPVIDVEEEAVVPQSRMVNSTFNPPMLLRDLSDVELEVEVLPCGDISRMLGVQIQELIRFLQSLQRGTELSVDLVRTIESIAMKFSGVTNMLMRRYDIQAADLLSLLRLNLRILTLMFHCSYVPGGEGAFDVHCVSLMLKQCTHAVYEICSGNLQPDGEGNNVLELTVSPPLKENFDNYNNFNNTTSDRPFSSSGGGVSGDVYQTLDEDCDIEEENEEGQYVPMRASSSSFKAPIAGAELCNNNCEIVGSTQLLQILEQLWPAIHAEINREIGEDEDEEAEKEKFLAHLVETAYFIARVFTILTKDETDCKRLNSAGAVKTLVTGVKVFQTSAMLSCVKTAASAQAKLNASMSGDDSRETNNDTVFTKCLTQMLSVLRSFSMISSCKRQLLEQNVVPRLCLLVKSYLKHPRVVMNCARVLGKLSPSDRGREQFNANSEHIHWLVDVVIHEANQMGGPAAQEQDEENDNINQQEPEWPGEHTWPILNRICFILGNLTNTNVENRRLIATEFGLTEHLVLLLHVCAESLQRMSRRNAGDASDSGSDEEEEEEGEEGGGGGGGGHSKKGGQSRQQDVNLSIDDDYNYHHQQAQEERQQGGGELISEDRSGEREFVAATITLVRLLANLSIDEVTGVALGSRPDTLEMLVKMLLPAMEGGSSGHEELLLNVVAACTNITFYSSQFVNKSAGSKGPRAPGTRATAADRILEVSTQLSAHLGQCLFHENSEIVLEAARVLGNLTRTAMIRSSLIDTRADETLVILLKHDQWDIVAAVAGVLVNLSADAHCKPALLKPSSHLLIVFSVVLRKVDTEYLELSCLICQALYNLFLGGPPAHSDSRTIQERIHKTLGELSATVRADQQTDQADCAAECASFLKVSAAVMALIEKHRSAPDVTA